MVSGIMEILGGAVTALFALWLGGGKGAGHLKERVRGSERGD